MEAYFPVGCPKCEWRGYMGRIAIGEILRIDDEVAEAYLSGKSAYEIKKFLKERKGFKDMLDDAMDKVRRGITSLEEVKRIVLIK